MLDFPEDELAEADAYYRGPLARQPRLDFDRPWHTRMMRLLVNLAYLDRKPLSSRGLKAEMRTVQALGRSARVRIIRPTTPARGILVDMHGGGWTLAHAVIDDPLNAEHADAGIAVVSVDYRLAPKVSLGEVIEDCETALAWAFDNAQAQFGTDTLLLNGDSAGAHLAISAILRRRDAGADISRLRAMSLMYGSFDLAGSPSVRGAAADTMVLNGASLPTLFRMVTRGASEDQRRDPAISPLYADLRGLPPTLLAVGTADPLIDDSRLMADRLTAAGVDAQLLVIPGAPHSFDRLPTRMATRFKAHLRGWLGSHLTA